ncbi:MAG: CoA transferase [Chloroflexota bacterium]
MNPGFRTYRCSSGQIEISVETPEQWHALAVCLGRPELAYEGGWDVVKESPAAGRTADVVQEMFYEDTAPSWGEKLGAHSVPFKVHA